MPTAEITVGTITYKSTWNESTSLNSCSCLCFHTFQLNPWTDDAEIIDAMCKQIYNTAFASTKLGTVFVSPSDYASRGRGQGYITSNFAHWLIANKIGIMCESPLFVNSAYGLSEKSHLCQMFTWIPPALVESGMVVEQTGGVHNVPEEYPLSYNRVPCSPKIGFNKLIHPALTQLKHFSKAAVLSCKPAPWPPIVHGSPTPAAQGRA